MKSQHIVSLILVFLLALTFPNLSFVRGKEEDVGYFLRSTVKYSNLSQDRVWDFAARKEDRMISLFLNTTWQVVALLNTSLPIDTFENDEDGNPVAVLSFPESTLKPGEHVSFTVWYHIIAKTRAMPDITEAASLRLADIPARLVDDYTRDEGSWQTSNETLRSLARSLRGSETNALTIIKNFIVWAKEHIKYPSPQARHETPYYPNETYTRGVGDCDDQAVLFITLSRIVGIPSFLQVGSIYLPDRFENASFWERHVLTVERRIGWHGWAVVYIPPWGWLPVDLTYVPEGFVDPLNAIRHGAVTGQNTIQQMNVTHADYVASALKARTFLVENGFQVYMEDEIKMDTQQGIDEGSSTVGRDQWTLIVALVVLTTLSVVVSLMIYRRFKRGTLEQAPALQENSL